MVQIHFNGARYYYIKALGEQVSKAYTTINRLKKYVGIYY